MVVPVLCDGLSITYQHQVPVDLPGTGIISTGLHERLYDDMLMYSRHLFLGCPPNIQTDIEPPKLSKCHCLERG